MVSFFFFKLLRLCSSRSAGVFLGDDDKKQAWKKDGGLSLEIVMMNIDSTFAEQSDHNSYPVLKKKKKKSLDSC